MKRNRQRLRSWVVDGSERNCRHLVTMMAWITSTAAVQAPAIDRADPEAGEEADGADQQQDHQRRREAVLGELPQQFVVEGDAGAGGRGQPVAGVADPLGGEPAGAWPAASRSAWECRGLLLRSRYATNANHMKSGLNSRKILKGKLKLGDKSQG